MSLENAQRSLEDIGLGDQRSSGSLSQNGKIVFLVTADTALIMDVNDQLVRYDGTVGACTITLPSVMEAAGRIYAITTIFTSGSVTIQDKDGDAALGDVSCTTAYTYVFFSTGYKWCKLFGAATT